MSAKKEAALAFERSFGSAPEGVAFAPGRVNLIGDHVDYNDGFVLPMPLSVGTAVAWRARKDDRVAVTASDLGSETLEFHLAEEPPVKSGWHSLVHGMVSVIQAQRPVERGLDILIKGDLPRGAGLSSSASLCVAIGRAVAEASGFDDMTPEDIARLAQRVEHIYAGVACGIMDQMAIAAGEPGAAMLLDCRTLETESIGLPEDWSVLVSQSGVTRELVDGAYNARRAECESAARKLGVESLRDVDPITLSFAKLDEVDAKRARHVVGEIERTRAAAHAIRNCAISDLGELMRFSHASMRDDFEASHPEVDRKVERLNEIIGSKGGARMTGGGFGGAIVSICHASVTRDVLNAIEQESDDRQLVRALN